jgi:hypothetical protein
LLLGWLGLLLGGGRGGGHHGGVSGVDLFGVLVDVMGDGRPGS